MESKNKRTGSPIIYKSSNLTVKAPDNNSRTCVSYYASFNTVDADLDIIKKGAFLKSINDRGPNSQSNRQIKFLHQHNIQEPCGVFNYLIEDDKGLIGEHVIEKTSLGDVIIERYANGIYREHSIGFQYVWDKCNWIEAPNDNTEDESKTIEVFECKELNLFECSVVTFGCNENTPFVGFKGTSEDLLKELESELNFLIKNAPNYEYELSIRKLYAKQISLAKSLADLNTKEEAKPKPTINQSFYQTLI